MILRFLFILFFLSSSIICFTQTAFDKGYFIDKDGKKTECLIKNMGWGIAPEKFTYKINETDQPIVLDATNVKEFGIEGDQKFYSFLLLADLTRIDAKKISVVKEKNLKQHALFLNPIVLGEVSLYEYKHNHASVFFVQKGDEIPEQLISKPYHKTDKKGRYDKPIYYNNSYIHTIWNEFKCGNTTTTDLDKVGYNRDDFSKYFKSYNSCMGFNAEVVGKKKKRKLGTWSFSVRPGISFVNVYVEDIFKTRSRVEYDPIIVGRLGLEAEFLHFRNNWSLFIEGSYQNFEAEKLKEIEFASVNQTDTEVIVITKYSSFDFPIGLRYYIYLNEDARIFVSGGASLFRMLQSGTVNSVGSTFLNFPLASGPNGFVSGGFQFKNKFRIDAKYDFKRDLAKNNLGNTAIYTAFSIIAGYTF